jgi:hypothetical protein
VNSEVEPGYESLSSKISQNDRAAMFCTTSIRLIQIQLLLPDGPSISLCLKECVVILMLFGGDLEAGILSQPTGTFSEGARQPRLICATHRKETEPPLSTYVGACTIMGVRWEEKDGLGG